MHTNQYYSHFGQDLFLLGQSGKPQLHQPYTLDLPRCWLSTLCGTLGAVVLELAKTLFLSAAAF